MVLAVSSPSPLWFLTRGTGAISLVLLTLTVALGIANVRRTRIGETPRFVLDSVHRSASLLAVSFVLVHVVATLLDGFAPITLLDTVIPFGSTYRPLWLGLGAVASDLLIAIVITSLLRRRLGYRAWRTTHWLAYASWPVALVHGLGTGSDTRTHWMLALVAACVAVMVAAVMLRVSAGWPEHVGARLSAVGAAGLVPLGLLAWLPSGPLAARWAKRAGTPASLLVGAHSSPGLRPTHGAGASGSSGMASSSQRTSAGSFSAQTVGRVTQVRLASGLMLVDVTLAAPGHALGKLDIRIEGPPIGGGGVQMTASRVTLGSSSNPDRYGGHVTALEGTNVTATVADRAGSALSLVARLRIAPGPGTATGTLTVVPRGSA
jgi:methionine sulfoxide reductase heme-binding subunit